MIKFQYKWLRVRSFWFIVIKDQCINPSSHCSFVIYCILFYCDAQNYFCKNNLVLLTIGMSESNKRIVHMFNQNTHSQKFFAFLTKGNLKLRLKEGCVLSVLIDHCLYTCEVKHEHRYDTVIHTCSILALKSFLLGHKLIIPALSKQAAAFQRNHCPKAVMLLWLLVHESGELIMNDKVQHNPIW